MANDVKLPKECVECYQDIKEHSAQVFKTMDTQFEEFIKNGEKKQDAMLTSQLSRFDKLEEKLTSMVKWFLSIVLVIISLGGGVVAWNFVAIQGKADKKEVLSLRDTKELFELRDAYSEQRYVLKPGMEMNENSNYSWLRETIFERTERSAREVQGRN